MSTPAPLIMTPQMRASLIQALGGDVDAVDTANNQQLAEMLFLCNITPPTLSSAPPRKVIRKIVKRPKPNPNPLELLENICILQCKEKEIKDELLSLHKKLNDLKNLISQKEEIQKKIAQFDQKQIEQEIAEKKSKSLEYKQSLQIFKAQHWDTIDLSKIELKIEQ
jgi:hypothetical protein